MHYGPASHLKLKALNSKDTSFLAERRGKIYTSNSLLTKH